MFNYSRYRPKTGTRRKNCFLCVHCLREQHYMEFFCKAKGKFRRTRQTCEAFEKRGKHKAKRGQP